MNANPASSTVGGSLVEKRFPIQRLLAARAFPHPTSDIELIETRLAWVVLTGPYAYKIKKPIKAHGVDHTTLQRRNSACKQEVERNHRLAPEIYLDVVPIAGPVDAPTVDGPAPAIEYAVRMRQFSQAARLDHLLEDDRIEVSDLDGIATAVSELHSQAPPAHGDDAYGLPETMERVAQLHVKWLMTHTHGRIRHSAKVIARWLNALPSQVADLIGARRVAGFVRELHGDLRLANLVKLDGRVRLFDRAEGDARGRYLDVMNDLAHLTMDFHLHGRTDLAYAVLNRYLERTGDYAGVALLRYFEVQCGLEWSRERCDDIAARLRSLHRRKERMQMDVVRHTLARAEPVTPTLILMHGMSGSGKTWLSERIMSALPAIRIRSDVERARLHALRPAVVPRAPRRADGPPGCESDLIHDHLARAASSVLKGGESVILDATLLRRAERQRFLDLSRHLQAGFLVVCCEVPSPEIRNRMTRCGPGPERRATVGADPIDRQLAVAEPLAEDERACVLTVDTRNPASVDALLASLRASTKIAHPRSRTFRKAAPSASPGADARRVSRGGAARPSTADSMTPHPTRRDSHVS